MSSLIEKMLTTTKLTGVDVMSESKFFSDKPVIKTEIPAMNIAFSGDLMGGFSSGLTIFAAESRHFKSLFALSMAKAFLKKYDDGVVLLYDSEFGSPPAYLETMGIDISRVVHIPVTNLEELKFDLMLKLNEINKKENVFILIDSIGNLASKKEVDDAKDMKSVADMTRAKQIKSLFRMCTPILTLKQVPLVVVNHVYDEQGLYAKKIMGGGQGPLLSADNVFFISKRQEKDGTDLAGYTFTMIAEKSRFIKEKSKIPITVKFDGGIDVFSGILDLAVEDGIVVKPSNGWYSIVDRTTGEAGQKLRRKEIETRDYMIPIMKDKDFQQFIRDKYMISGSGKLLVSEGVDLDE